MSVRTTRTPFSRNILKSAFLACSAVLIPCAAGAQVRAAYEEGIVELVADRLPPYTVIVLVDGSGSMLLPLEHVTAFLGLSAQWNGGVYSFPALDGTAAIDTATKMMRTPTDTVQLAASELVTGAPLYLRTERIAELLDAEVIVDMATLTVAFVRATSFPAQQRVIAEQRRAMLLARQAQLERRAQLDSVQYGAPSGVGVLDWEIATAGLDPSELTTVRTQAGAAVFGGDLNAGAIVELGDAVTRHRRDLTLRYQRIFPTGRYLTQIRAGDVLSSGLFARHMRGVEVSNQPFFRSLELSSVLLDPDLPTGWEYEVFQGNQLLGYSDIGSTQPVAVPLRAGTTPVQVRLYGPAGEEVITSLLYQTPVSLLRRNTVEYAVGGGRCAAGCDEFVHADVRYGVTSLFTAGGGIELFTDSAGHDFRPYFVYSFGTGTTATAELTYMPFSLYAADVRLFPRDGTTAQLRASVSRPGFGPITLLTGTDRRWDTELFWDERIERPFPFSQLRLGASAAGLLESFDRWRISAMGSFARGFLEARYDHDRVSVNNHLLSTRAAVYAPFSVGGLSIRPLVTGAIGFSDVGVQLGELGFSVQPRQAMMITAGAQWNRGSSRPSFSISFNAYTGSVQTAVRAVSTASAASSTISLSGSSSFAHDGSFTFQPFARTGYGGIHGTVFVDNDGDGAFSPGDTTVPDIHILAAGHRAVTDSAGRFRIWNLQPYQPIAVSIDSTRTPDPSWTTVLPRIGVRPAPNMSIPTDIRLVRTRELVGSITAAPDGPTVAGITIMIRALDPERAGEDVVTTTTFSDGFFYISRLRPGRYRLEVSPASLNVLGAIADPASMEFVIPDEGSEPLVELPPIRITRR